MAFSVSNHQISILESSVRPSLYAIYTLYLRSLLSCPVQQYTTKHIICDTACGRQGQQNRCYIRTTYCMVYPPFERRLKRRSLTEQPLQIVARTHQCCRCPGIRYAGTALGLATFLHLHVLGQLFVPVGYLELAEEELTRWT